MELAADEPPAAYLAPAPLIDCDARDIGTFVEERLHRCDPVEAVRRVFHVVREFPLDVEKLAFSVRASFDEIAYPTPYARPHPTIARTLAENDDAIVMYRNGLPSALE